MILGLDASSVMVGYCILRYNGEFVSVGHLDLHKYENLYQKIHVFNSFFREIVSEHKISSVAIEQPALMFQKASTAHVMSLLQRWNGFVCAQIYLESGIQPLSISAASARKAAGIKIPKGIKGKGTKEYILSFIQSLGIVPESHWIYKKTGTVKDYHFDECDAIVVAKAGLVLEKE